MRRTAGAGALVLALASLPAAGVRGAVEQTFKAAVDAVRVDVLVTRGGRPVTGLTSADFELRDSGVVQEIEAVAVEDVPITVTLVLDVSESVEGQPLQHLRSAIAAAAGVLSPNDRMAFFTFSHRVELSAGPTADRDRVRSAAAAVGAGGATSLYDATFASLVMRERIDGRAVMLVFSDGNDTASWLDPRAVVAAAQRSDVVVYAVTLERQAERENLDAVMRDRREQEWFLEEPSSYDRQYLPMLAAETGGSVLIAERSDQLRDTFVRVVNEFKSHYILTYAPRQVASGGWHPIAVSVKGRRADVTARRGYVRGAK